MTQTHIVYQALRAARAVFSFATWCVCAAAFMSVYFAFQLHRQWQRSGRPVFGWRWRLVRLPHQWRAAWAVHQQVLRYQRQQQQFVAALQRVCGIRPSFPWVRVALGCAVAVLVVAFAWQWAVLLGAVVASIGIQFVGHWFLFGGRQQYQQQQQLIAQRRAQCRR